MIIERIVKEKIISEVELDYYIPITVEYRENDLPTKEMYYYRILNNKSSFIEF